MTLNSRSTCMARCQGGRPQRNANCWRTSWVDFGAATPLDGYVHGPRLVRADSYVCSAACSFTEASHLCGGCLALPAAVSLGRGRSSLCRLSASAMAPARCVPRPYESHHRRALLRGLRADALLPRACAFRPTSLCFTAASGCRGRGAGLILVSGSPPCREPWRIETCIAAGSAAST